MKEDLQLLLRRNVDGHRGYSLAATKIKNHNFKHFLESYADQREHFAEQLVSALKSRGLEAPQKSSMLGDIHMAIFKLTSSTVGLSDENIMKECARGESQALLDYEKVIKNNALAPEIQEMIIMQRDKIAAAERTLRELVPVIERQ